MKRRTSILDRIVTLLAGCALLTVAGLGLAWWWGTQWARTVVHGGDRSQLSTIPDQQWWPTALAVSAVVAFVVGLALLLINVRRGRPETMPVLPGPTDPAEGGADLSVDLGPLAVGLAGELAAQGGVRAVRSSVVDDRGLATLRIIVVAEPTIDVVGFTVGAEALARSMAAALPGAPVATQVLLHLDPP